MRNWPTWTPWRCAPTAPVLKQVPVLRQVPVLGVGAHAEAGARAEAGASVGPGASVEVVVIAGEAGIGKTTQRRTRADRRAAAGDSVRVATGGQLDLALPLDALLTGLAALLQPARAGGGRGAAGGRRAAARARAGPGP